MPCLAIEFLPLSPVVLPSIQSLIMRPEEAIPKAEMKSRGTGIRKDNLL